MTRRATRWLGRPPKLTDEQVRRVLEAERLRKAVPSRRALAREFGVTRGTIDAYATGRHKRGLGELTGG